MIETKRLTIKKIREGDQEAGLNLLTNDIVKQTYMLPDFEKREDAIPLFQRLQKMSVEDKRYVRGIYLKDYLIGYANEVEIIDNSVELGYLIHPDYHGRGYMTEALRAYIGHLFEHTQAKLVSARVFDGNVASQALLLGLGFTHEGTLRHAVGTPGGIVHDDRLYSLLRQEWEKRG